MQTNNTAPPRSRALVEEYKKRVRGDANASVGQATLLRQGPGGVRPIFHQNDVMSASLALKNMKKPITSSASIKKYKKYRKNRTGHRTEDNYLANPDKSMLHFWKNDFHSPSIEISTVKNYIKEMAEEMQKVEQKIKRILRLIEIQREFREELENGKKEGATEDELLKARNAQLQSWGDDRIKMFLLDDVYTTLTEVVDNVKNDKPSEIAFVKSILRVSSNRLGTANRYVRSMEFGDAYASETDNDDDDLILMDIEGLEIN